MQTLVDPSLDGAARFAMVVASATAVASEFDTLGVLAPAVCADWVAYERQGLAELLAEVPVTHTEVPTAEVRAWKRRAGRDSMDYYDAMAKLVGPFTL